MQINQIKKQQSGIYCIINTINNKQYIGSSKLVRKRLLQHKNYLIKNKHINKKLQNSWNKYTDENFHCIILEYCNIDKLFEREQYYIDNLKPELNICLTVGRYPTKQNIRVDKIYKYDLYGNYISEYYDLVEASIENNITLSSIYRCINKEYKKGGNFIWSLEKKESIEPYKRNKKETTYLNKQVKVLDYYTNELVFKFNSLKECAEYFKTHRPSISYAIKVKQKFKKKYLIIKS